MGNKMLIDATHPEETRVVVLRGNRVEEFDFESAAKKQLRGNIYLAKVTRVEPSLQAAFVNYGGNRHGFLAFNEIHPDYYQLPLAERQALKAEDERARKRSYSDDGDAGSDDADASADGNGNSAAADEEGSDAASSAVDDMSPEDTVVALEAALPPAKYSANLYDENASDTSDTGAASKEGADAAGTATSASAEAAANSDAPHGDDDGEDDGEASSEEAPEGNGVESVGSEDAMEELPERVRRRRRPYKIQEVIKRGQIILVQVVKEERGNKGAALTTYLSLAGRYTVLMPNTGSGGGISRKISSPGDRKRLREIADELDVPEGMGLIIRTAGAARTKTEIKRDYEYLLRLWENVRDLTLKSTAPALVYEEGDLIKRTIRDLYSREIDEVLVAGDIAYRDAKDFMRMLMPSHAKNVQAYTDAEPIFTRYEVERQLNAMFSPQVTLPSGGYIVINQTEALVAVDVNSGKATREFSIEDTALKTNMEAAEEISRQLRLRDLAGLIVVDFIDMEEKRNNRSVERRLKECLRNDRARIQVGHISHFGLLEMSRQRLRTGMIEGSTTQCPHCQGTGVIRSTESVALSVLRSLEDWLRTNPPSSLNAITSLDVALYILNNKRSYLRGIEERYTVSLAITASERMQGSSFYIEKVAAAAPAPSVSHAVTQSDRIIQPFEDEEPGPEEEGDEDSQQQKNKRRRRRRRGRGGESTRHDGLRHDNHAEPREPGHSHTPRAVSPVEADEDDGFEETADNDNGNQPAQADGDDDGSANRRRRRRGRRGGRHQRTARGPREGTPHDSAEQPQPDYHSSEVSVGRSDAGEAQPGTSPAGEAESAKAEPATIAVQPESGEKPAAAEAAADAAPSGRQRANGAQRAAAAVPAAPEPEAEPVETSGTEDAEPVQAAESEMMPKPRGPKRGWWQRRMAG